MIMQIPLNYSYHECITWVEIACISGKDSFFDFSNSLMEKHPNSKWKFCGPIPSGTKVNLINSYLREETTPKNEINRRQAMEQLIYCMLETAALQVGLNPDLRF
ncbi:uncharacterized protein LOC117171909 isoform X1 [Belonocnema kinseyi]|uniref:uncharacterized protein LOC117171909 isoform X1 n=1 Tax=Belonocnema kinseyi TaxID=2817044 RepID=UPI00143DA8C0|nr:uncharacterized protein LOC117171909 isoform X1 [Belonocnema kinseyi]XP_033215450.1 uncharacterized protein LOC117171909 isoform X1 [Belonocnema kinseyi]XP_033215453.1 uncharacterized protein LOC117171909 isoform X1 [Belonocnema kinseyi]